MGRLEDGYSVADVGPRSDAQSADLRGGSVGDMSPFRFGIASTLYSSGHNSSCWKYYCDVVIDQDLAGRDFAVIIVTKFLFCYELIRNSAW